MTEAPIHPNAHTGPSREAKMSKAKGELCSCGFPQSCPIPHEHDQTVREKAIVKHFENRMRDLVKQREDLLTGCKALFLRVVMHYSNHQEICKLGKECPDKKALELAEAAIEQAKPKPEGGTL